MVPILISKIMKIFSIYIYPFILYGVFLVILGADARMAGGVPTWVQTVVQKVNALRRSVGVPPVCLNMKLINAAKRYSQIISPLNIRSHFHGTRPKERVMMAGFLSPKKVAENLAGPGPVDQTFEQLRLSPLHYRNMVDPNVKFIGVGGISNSDTPEGIQVQVFASANGESCMDVNQGQQALPQDVSPDISNSNGNNQDQPVAVVQQPRQENPAAVDGTHNAQVNGGNNNNNNNNVIVTIPAANARRHPRNPRPAQPYYRGNYNWQTANRVYYHNPPTSNGMRRGSV